MKKYTVKTLWNLISYHFWSDEHKNASMAELVAIVTCLFQVNDGKEVLLEVQENISLSDGDESADQSEGNRDDDLIEVVTYTV